MKKLLALCLVVACGAAAAQHESTITIGRQNADGGSLTLLVRQREDGTKGAMLFMVDEYRVKSNALFPSRSQLVRIRDMIDQTLEKLDEQQPPPR